VISLSRGYNELSFREDLKVLYNRLGVENRKIVFMFSDQHIVEDGIPCAVFFLFKQLLYLSYLLTSY